MEEYSWWGKENPPPSRYVTAKLLREKFMRPLKPAGFIRGDRADVFLYDQDDPASVGAFQPQTDSEWTQWNEFEKGNEYHRWSNRNQGRFATDRYEALIEVQRIVSQPYVIVDTETTGIHGAAEPVEIAVIDCRGQTLLNTRIKPTICIPPEASVIHGIYDIDVKYSPSFAAIAPELAQILTSSRVLAYNLHFDTEIIENAFRRSGLDIPAVNRLDHQLRSCLMKLYAIFKGDWQGRKRGYRWQKLDGGHSALSDCRAAWARLLEMRDAEIVTPEEAFERFWAEQLEHEQMQHLAKCLEWWGYGNISMLDCLRWSH